MKTIENPQWKEVYSELAEITARKIHTDENVMKSRLRTVRHLAKILLEDLGEKTNDN